jgi:hypothetical protein
MYRPAVEQWITRDPELAGSRLALALTAVALAMTASALGFAAYFWRLGAKAVRAERFPPPGLATVRDTPIVRGPAARRRGRLLQSAAVALAVVAGAIPFLVWRLLSLVPT